MHNQPFGIKRHSLVKFMLLASILALILSACAQSAAPTPAYEQNFAGAPAMAPEAAADQAKGGISRSTVNVAQAADRIVIKNANLSIVVADPGSTMDVISRMADDMGGFVVSANLYHSTLESGAEVPHASITIRVPAERLNEALEQIRSQSDRDPLNERVDSQDITQEYTDLQSRLRNLQNTEAQLTKIMDDAIRTEDVLSVYNRLVDIREQIEVIQGQIKYYEESAALSAISVELIANEAVQPLTIGGWQPVGVAKNAVQALIDTLKFVANAAIWIVIYILPVLLVLYLIFVLPLSLVWKAWRRRRARGKAIQAVQPQASPPTNPEN
jgi:hypothetical protein